jgi:hypothetical protein
VHAVSSSIAVGGLVCTDGNTDKEVCSVRVDETDDSVSYSGITLQHQIFFHQTAGHNAFSQGDSGGPIYTVLSDGSVEAQAQLIALVTGDPTQGWGTFWKTVDIKLNVSIITS